MLAAAVVVVVAAVPASAALAVVVPALVRRAQRLVESAVLVLAHLVREPAVAAERPPSSQSFSAAMARTTP
jgi:hypothetical protein